MLKTQLKTFLAVCEAGSFTAAAQRLFITPSAVVQQISLLEKDLGASLFDRSQRGVRLTPAGEYLKEQTIDMQRKSEAVRKEVSSIALQEKHVCIGTSLFEKCRLLYELWVIFSQQEPEYEIQMVTLNSGEPISEKTDLIESVNSGVAWMPQWDFLKICDVPFGIALPHDHPLAAKERLSRADLAGHTVLSVNRGSSGTILSMLESMKQSGVHIEYAKTPNASVLWESSFRQRLLLVPLCWEDILINMTIRPCDWSYTIPYGIFHRRSPSPSTARFLEFIRQTYAEGNAAGVVPVL